MTRARTLVPLAAAGALALAVVPALPAAAATITWTQAGDSWWSSATWSGGTPVAGDTVVFDGGPRSTYNLGNVTFDGLSFLASHEIANGGGRIGVGTSGVELAPGVAGIIGTDITTVGAQTWTVPAGSSLTIPTLITTDGSGTLTLDVDGTLAVSGNIDALGTGSVVQTGTGTVVRSGGSGGGIAGGYRVNGGTFLLDSASIGGTAFTLEGGTLAGAGVINALAFYTGTLAPGSTAAPSGTIVVAGAATLDGGTYAASLDAATASGDYVMVYGASLSGVATTLAPTVEGTPTAGDSWEIIGADATATVDPGFRFLSPAGATLEDGDEFVSDGARWAISYTAGVGGVVAVEYLGEAPVVVTPVVPAAPAPAAALAESGIDTVSAITGGLAGVLLVAAGVVAVAARRRDRVPAAR